MKKYMPGFVPVNFNQVGKILLIIGLICAIIKVVSYLTEWFFAPNYLIYIGAGLIVLSRYLMFVVSRK